MFLHFLQTVFISVKERVSLKICMQIAALEEMKAALISCHLSVCVLLVICHLLSFWWIKWTSSCYRIKKHRLSTEKTCKIHRVPVITFKLGFKVLTWDITRVLIYNTGLEIRLLCSRILSLITPAIYYYTYALLYFNITVNETHWSRVALNIDKA